MEFIKIIAEPTDRQGQAISGEGQPIVLIPMSKVLAIYKSNAGYIPVFEEGYLISIRFKFIGLKTNVEKLFQQADTL